MHDRNPILAQKAMSHFAAALGLYHDGAALLTLTDLDGSMRNQRIEGLTSQVALARVRQGDKLLEELMRMQLPPKLVFNPVDKRANAAVVQQFESWRTRKQKKLAEADAQYQRVAALKSSHWELAAEARRGQLFLSYANELYTAIPPIPPMPPPLSSSGRLEGLEWQWLARDAFCDYMTDTAEPLDRQAKDRLLACIRKATELGTFNEWSRLCEVELHQLNAKEYPLPAELPIEPDAVVTPMQVAPPF